MNMTLESDQRPHLTGIPWFQKTRPGVRTNRAVTPLHSSGNPHSSPADTASASIIASPKVAAAPDKAVEPRLIREAGIDADDEIPLKEIACLSIVVTALMLFAAIALSGCNWDERKIVVVSAGDRVVPIVATVDRR